MYIDNDDFNVWMQKLYAKLEEIGKDVRILLNEQAEQLRKEADKLGKP